MKKVFLLAVLGLFLGTFAASAYHDTGPSKNKTCYVVKIEKKSVDANVATGTAEKNCELSAMDIPVQVDIDIRSTYGIPYEDMLTTQHAYRKLSKFENVAKSVEHGRSLGGGYMRCIIPNYNI